jgi:class 3 adenylate cyclase
MFTDLADYTAKVSKTDRAGLRKILLEHEELVSPIVQRYHGEVVKNLGDSFMCLFDAATDALRACLEIQDLVRSGKGFSLRIGLTTGDVEEIAGDAFGESVNLAARILSKTPAGEVWFSGTTRACMNSAEIPWEGVGRFRFKGIADEIDVSRAVPGHRCWLPDAVFRAARDGRLVRLKRGHRPTSLLPADPVILLEGFAPGSPELKQALAGLPVIDPANIFMSTYHISAGDRVAWTESGHGLVIGLPQPLEMALHDAQRLITHSSGSDTIVIETSQSVDMVLVISGIALPAVPMSDVVASYSYDLLDDGRWVNRSDRAVLRVEVVSDGARLHVTSAGVRIDGRSRSLDEVVVLQDGATIDTPAGQHVYRRLDGQAFAGAILGETPMRLGVLAGQAAEIGREPQHPGLAFPDRRGQSNIRWCSGGRAARARASGFTLDRALAGRRQAAITMMGDDVQVTPLHNRCPTWLLRDRGQGLERVGAPTRLSLGDYVVAGTTVVGVRGPDAY